MIPCRAGAQYRHDVAPGCKSSACSWVSPPGTASPLLQGDQPFSHSSTHVPTTDWHSAFEPSREQCNTRSTFTFQVWSRHRESSSCSLCISPEISSYTSGVNLIPSSTDKIPCFRVILMGLCRRAVSKGKAPFLEYHSNKRSMKTTPPLLTELNTLSFLTKECSHSHPRINRILRSTHDCLRQQVLILEDPGAKKKLHLHGFQKHLLS